MFARFLEAKAVNSRVGSLIKGVHLAHSYAILSLGFVRNLTHFKDSYLTIKFLGLMRVVVNLGGGYGIPPEDEVQVEQPVQGPRPRGCRNVRGGGDRGQPQQHHAPMEGGPCHDVMMVGYMDRMQLSMN